MANKYWVANNPNSEINDAKAQKLAELSATNVTLAELNELDSTVGVKDITEATVLTAADNGKMCLINYDGNAAIVVELPAKSIGLEFKFMFISTMDAASSQVRIKADTANDLCGSVECLKEDGAGSFINTSGSAHNALQISDNIKEGTYVNFFCNGSKWYVNGKLYSDSADAGGSAFAAV